jgi:hypothetical protein
VVRSDAGVELKICERLLGGARTLLKRLPTDLSTIDFRQLNDYIRSHCKSVQYTCRVFISFLVFRGYILLDAVGIIELDVQYSRADLGYLDYWRNLLSTTEQELGYAGDSNHFGRSLNLLVRLLSFSRCELSALTASDFDKFERAMQKKKTDTTEKRCAASNALS